MGLGKKIGIAVGVAAVATLIVLVSLGNSVTNSTTQNGNAIDTLSKSALIQELNGLETMFMNQHIELINERSTDSNDERTVHEYDIYLIEKTKVYGEWNDPSCENLADLLLKDFNEYSRKSEYCEREVIDTTEERIKAGFLEIEESMSGITKIRSYVEHNQDIDLMSVGIRIAEKLNNLHIPKWSDKMCEGYVTEDPAEELRKEIKCLDDKNVTYRHWIDSNFKREGLDSHSIVIDNVHVTLTRDTQKFFDWTIELT